MPDAGSSGPELMNELWNSRTVALLGPEGESRLSQARVLVVGVGGVGGYVAEMLVRSGVGSITLLDSDAVAPSNINRQLVATHSAIGESKVHLFAQRFREINPACEVTPLQEFLTPDTVAPLLSRGFDFVADCIDTVAPKVALLRGCLEAHVKVISSMGAGGRLDPTQVRYARLRETREDGLARAVRGAFKKQGSVPDIKVVYSTEAPRRAALLEMQMQNKRSSFGTLATIPAIFGIYMANHIIRSLSQQ